MSLILNALKKLDRDRAAGSAGKRDITAEILKADDHPRRSGLFPLAITLGVTASVAALVTFIVIGGSGPRTGDAPAKAPAARLQDAKSVTAPLPSVPTAVPDKPSPPQVASSATPPHATSAVKQTPGKTNEVGEPAARGRASGREENATKASPRPMESKASRPAVKISAIIWQEEPSERKAMINGRVARQGDLVDGMKVLEIQPSHVKISFEGKPLTVGMFE